MRAKSRLWRARPERGVRIPPKGVEREIRAFLARRRRIRGIGHSWKESNDAVTRTGWRSSPDRISPKPEKKKAERNDGGPATQAVPTKD